LRLPSLWWLPLGKAPEVNPQILHSWLSEGKQVQVIDARTLLEFQQGTIADARHAPLTDMPGSMEKLPIDALRPVVVLCLTGHRSRPGTRWLRAKGIEAYSLAGGVIAWKKAGYELQPPKS
jgi:rhodanese-related sulfurtransferase